MRQYDNQYEETIEGGIMAMDEYFEDDALLAKSELLISPEYEEEVESIPMEEYEYVE